MGACGVGRVLDALTPAGLVGVCAPEVHQLVLRNVTNLSGVHGLASQFLHMALNYQGQAQVCRTVQDGVAGGLPHTVCLPSTLPRVYRAKVLGDLYLLQLTIV